MIPLQETFGFWNENGHCLAMYNSSFLRLFSGTYSISCSIRILIELWGNEKLHRNDVSYSVFESSSIYISDRNTFPEMDYIVSSVYVNVDESTSGSEWYWTVRVGLCTAWVARISIICSYTNMQFLKSLSNWTNFQSHVKELWIFHKCYVGISSAYIETK